MTTDSFEHAKEIHAERLRSILTAPVEKQYPFDLCMEVSDLLFTASKTKDEFAIKIATVCLAHVCDLISLEREALTAEEISEMTHFCAVMLEEWESGVGA